MQMSLLRRCKYNSAPKLPNRSFGKIKKLALIATIFIMIALVFAPSHLALAGSTFYADPLTRGAGDTTAETTTDDLKADDGAYYEIGKNKTMEVVTFATSAGTINHARLHIIYYVDSGYNGSNYFEYKPQGGSYSPTGIQPLGADTSETSKYWELPRSAIDTWAEIGNMSIRFPNIANKDIWVELLEINVTYDATLASYSNDARTTACEDFDDPSEQTVYMLGTGFEANLEYKTAYYMDTVGLGLKVDSDITEAATGGTLDESQCLITAFYDFTGTETWKAVVFYPATEPAPSDYAAALTSDYFVIEDTFTVYEGIPEFPTIFAAIVVAGLCFGIYYWMRKRRLVYVKG